MSGSLKYINFGEVLKHPVAQNNHERRQGLNNDDSCKPQIIGTTFPKQRVSHFPKVRALLFVCICNLYMPWRD